MKLPELHRLADHKADWEGIPYEKMNPYQQRAVDTFGIDTPGNRITAIGALESAAGLELLRRNHKLHGTVMLGLGRYKDMQDGKRADETDTKSPFGAALDANTDAALLAWSLPILRDNEIITDSEVLGIQASLLLKGTAVAVAKLRGRKMNVSRAGKYAGFAVWLGIGSRLTGDLVSEYINEDAGKILTNAGKALGQAGTALSILSSSLYLHEALGEIKQDNTPQIEVAS